jgi:hypothetical protein
MTSARRASFTTTMGMVDGIHRHTSYGWSDAAPPFRTSLAQLPQGVLGVTDFADDSATVDRHSAHFAGAALRWKIGCSKTD